MREDADRHAGELLLLHGRAEDCQVESDRPVQIQYRDVEPNDLVCHVALLSCQCQGHILFSPRGQTSNLREKTMRHLAITLATALAAASARAEGTPKIQFDKTVYDFGVTSLVESVTGTFTFQN